MPHLLDSIAKLTEHRDRAALERAVLDVVARCAPSTELALYRCIGSPQEPRLLLAARAGAGAEAKSVAAAWDDLEDLPSARHLPVHAHALQSRSVVDVLPDASPDSAGARALHVYPVEGAQQFAGLIEVRASQPLSPRQRAQIGAVLGIYRNHLRLLDYGETDSLTGLLNRKTYEQAFHEQGTPDAADAQAPMSQRERRAVAMQRWLGVIDIDHFKRVNDRFGHLIGDELLLLVAQLMRAAFRHGDSLFRFGGEEFVVLLRAPDRGHAMQAFERFRVRMATHAFPQVGQVTASVGFTMLLPSDLPSSAFERTDRAVYFAKQNGRNQVRCHEDLVEGGAVAVEQRVGEVELF